MSKKALLALADGTIFHGRAFGAEAPITSPAVGEVVFNTSMYGYQEIVTMLASHGGRGDFIAGVSEQIRLHLAENGISNPQLSSRVKSIYGIYRKMFIQNKEFEEIYDVYALR